MVSGYGMLTEYDIVELFRKYFSFLCSQMNIGENEYRAVQKLLTCDQLSEICMRVVVFAGWKHWWGGQVC